MGRGQFDAGVNGLMLHCFVSLFSLTSYKKKYLLQLQEENVVVLIRSFPCSLATACRYYNYSMCVCVKRKFQFVTGENRPLSIY